jgi:hypothetical protein
VVPAGGVYRRAPPSMSMVTPVTRRPAGGAIAPGAGAGRRLAAASWRMRDCMRQRIGAFKPFVPRAPIPRVDPRGSGA